MPDIITLTGFVATIPRALTTAEGLAITSFRLASSQRRYDRTQDKWIDGETNWYTITAFRLLATNAAMSVHRGDRVVVTGKMRVRSYESNGKTGTNVEVDADALGHDLSWGTAAFSRNTGSLTVESGGLSDGADASAPSGWATNAVPSGERNGESVSDSDDDPSPDLVGAATGGAAFGGAATGGSAAIETPF